MRNLILAGFAALALAGAADARPLATLSAQPFGSGFSGALCMVQDPLDTTIMYVVQQTGLVRRVINGVTDAVDFANFGSGGMNIILTGSERGLLGMAFAPDYATSGRVFFYFTSNGVAVAGFPTPPSGAIIWARFTTQTVADATILNPGSRFDLALTSNAVRWIPHPISNHNGGTLNFSGLDGYLYAGIGDGGGAGDTSNNAQNPNMLLGKILRVNPNVPDSDLEGFDIPATNPFVAANNPPIAANELIWSFGMRNPWKHGFDDYGHGRLDSFIIGDVGQDTIEEVDFQPPGAGGYNHGWRRFEGNNVFSPGTPLAYDLGGSSNYRYVPPVHTYSHSVGFTVIGGYMYRGHAMCSFKGRYFFADLNGRVWSMRLDNGVMSDLQEHTVLGGGSIVGFGRDAAGELYIVKQSSIIKITSNDAPLTGDADGDRDVDFGDLNFVLSQFSQTGPAGGYRPLTGDVNDDGIVNFADLNIVLSSFGANCF